MSLDKRDYVFRSFWDREDCFNILRAFWEKFKSGGSITYADYARVSQKIAKGSIPGVDGAVNPDAAPKAADTTTTTAAAAAIPAAPGGNERSLCWDVLIMPF